ncbi:methyltransferase domain-containing protein [Verminephrobacter eiseniae]|uniref:tetratricopeptide repeat protein n=1 Tax=Verminephrobacter eiseniae TaxID=364317 RepID=UPI002237FFD5|nr:tetratricopeptide repeat protein [Verminephrobacter eiseniae]MCW5263481.1 methyltransferase domain-containing protein [Verminephrobacter eiseniae]
MSAIARDPNIKHLIKARGQIAKGDLKNAALTLNQANARWPQDPRVFMLGGLMAEKAGHLQGAFESLRKAVALAPDWGPGLLELALLLARQNQFQEAVEIAERLALLEPGNLQVLAGVVDIAHRSGHTAMAVRHLRRGLALVPGDVELRRLLARDLSEQGQHDEALALWSALVAENPADSGFLRGHVQACIAAGKPAQAQKSCAALLAQAPEDPVCQYYAQLAGGQTPDRQPAELVRPLFDELAESYDQHMVRSLKYQLPRQVADKIITRHPDKKINVLDLGCGTGLLGVCLGRLDGFLIGVDLSMKMLEQAARHQLYDRFHTVNLHDALRATPPGLYQVIAALDVFIYAGELSLAIADAHRILTADGLLILSCEIASETGPDLVLLPAGRYAHKRSHVQALCQAAGFDAVEIEDSVLRYENHQPVAGFVVTAHKPA